MQLLFDESASVDVYCGMKRNYKTNPEREARKAKLRALAGEISKMSDAQRAELSARCLALTIEGRTLSLHNQCLIAHQIPSATVLGGFRQWLKAGRAVVKGEHGAAIWVPINCKIGNGAAIDGVQPDLGESAEQSRQTRFMLGTVFDVSQTQEIETAAREHEANMELTESEAQ